jgi:hypothetical protein
LIAATEFGPEPTRVFGDQPLLPPAWHAEDTIRDLPVFQSANGSKSVIWG